MLKLKDWLYRNVDDDTIDASSKEVIEVVSNTTCKMLEKATEADVQGLQAFTIRKLDTKMWHSRRNRPTGAKFPIEIIDL